MVYNLKPRIRSKLFRLHIALYETATPPKGDDRLLFELG